LTHYSPKQTPKRRINIAGAGIAGMTAAINLKKFDHDVVIIEKGTAVGSNRHGDMEGLESWIFEGSMSSFFNEHGFNFSMIDTVPIHHFTVHCDEHESFKVSSSSPLFYMIQRGEDHGCFDLQLFEQCVDAGVEFIFNQNAPDDVDIDSTGTKRAAAFIKGINFHSSLPDQVHLLLGSQYAPKGYAYLIILNGKATLAIAFKNPPKITDPLENTIKYFREQGFKIPHGPVFGSRGSFSLMRLNLDKRPLRIGEAGGFQDLLFGFGMRMAMNSGLAAAHIFNNDRALAKQIIRELERKRKLSYVNRFLYERLNDRQMAAVAKRFSKSDSPLEILSRAYEWNFHNILRWMKHRGNLEVRTS